MLSTHLEVHKISDPAVQEDGCADGCLDGRVVERRVPENGPRFRGCRGFRVVLVVFREQGGRRRRVLQPEVPVPEAGVDVGPFRTSWNGL